VFSEFARLAADGKFTVPIAATFPLEDWRTAIGLTGSRRAGIVWSAACCGQFHRRLSCR
jgi:hypothetical protein